MTLFLEILVVVIAISLARGDHVRQFPPGNGRSGEQSAEPSAFGLLCFGVSRLSSNVLRL